MRRPTLTARLCAAASLAAAAAAFSGTAFAADPTTADCLAASDASRTSGNAHKLRAERSQLLICASASCPTDIRKECSHRMEELSGDVPTIVFEVKDIAGNDLVNVKVTMDAEVLAERLPGTAISIDPGEHAFTFETPGQSPVMKRLVIRQGQKDRRETIIFGKAPTGSVVTATGALPPPPAPPAAPPPVTVAPAPETVAVNPFPPAPSPSAAPAAPVAPLTTTSSDSGMGTQKILAITAGGVGVVGLGVGIAMGAVALSKKSSAETICPGATCTTGAGQSAWSSAASAGNISTVGWIIGAAGLAGGTVLWFTAPSGDSQHTTVVGVGPGMVQVGGTF